MTDHVSRAVRVGGALLLATAMAGCGIPRADLALQGAYLVPGGKVGVSRGRSQVTTRVDDLNLDGQVVVLPRAALGWGGLHLRADGFTGTWSGNGTATARLDAGDGHRIEAGTDVATDVELTYATAAATYDLVPSDVVDLGLGLGAGWLGYDLMFASRESRARVSVDDSTPFAYPALHVASDLGIVRLSGDLGGIALSAGDRKLTYVDADVRAALRLFEGVASGYLVAGYRYLLLDYEDEQGGSDVRADVTFQGPYLGFQVSF
jgi:hypothetical protein